jgi:hypothetical protein
MAGANIHTRTSSPDMMKRLGGGTFGESLVNEMQNIKRVRFLDFLDLKAKLVLFIYLDFSG